MFAQHFKSIREAVVAKLAEQLLQTSEVRGSNPIIDQLLCRTFVYSQLYWKDENKENRGREWPNKNIF